MGVKPKQSLREISGYQRVLAVSGSLTLHVEGIIAIPMHWRCPADDRYSQREWKCQSLRALVYGVDKDFLFNHCCQAKQKGVHRDVGHRIVFLFGFSFHFLPSQQQNPIFHEEVASFVSIYQRLQSCFLNRSGFHSRHSVRKQILISC